MVLKPCARPPKPYTIKPWVVYKALHMVLKPFARLPKTMYNKTTCCLGCVAYGFKTICKDLLNHVQ